MVVIRDTYGYPVHTLKGIISSCNNHIPAERDNGVLQYGNESSDILVFKKQNWEIRAGYNAFRDKALKQPLD